MPVRPLPPQFQQYESSQSANPTNSPGTTVNNPTGAANTKDTTWTTLIASTSFDAQMLIVHISGSATSSTDTSTLIDIGIGAAASESVLVPDLLAGWAGAAAALGGFPRHVILPLYVPAGSRLSARSQSVRTTGSTKVWVELLGGPRGADWWCGSEVKAYGITGASSRGTNVTQGGSSGEGSWTSIGTTSQDHKAVCLLVQGSNTDTTMQNAGQAWDVAIDTTSPAILMENFLTQTSTGEALGQLGIWLPVYADFVSGSVLAVRGSCTVATPDVIDVALYGVS
jgi:hypothetical protein